MIRVKIKTKKQDNGLWETPNNCYKISGLPPDDPEIEILSSAIITAIDEKYNLPFYIEYKTYEKGFFISLKNEDDGLFKLHYIMYDICLLEDDTIIYFDDIEERKTYLRKHKIKNIKNLINGRIR